MQEHLPSHRSDWTAGEPSDAERALLASFIDAHERGDAALAVSIAASDIRSPCRRVRTFWRVST
jgi:RNA polymerase sigma-70 factor (ECF subfamily)